MKFLPIAVAAALGLAFAQGAAAGKDDKGSKDNPTMMQPSKVVEAVLSDDTKKFFETALSANQFEIDSSELARNRATDLALKSFADKMVKDHVKAGDELQKLAKQKGLKVAPLLLKRHQMMLDDLKDEKAGKPFDDEYRSKMVMSHKEAVSLFDEQARDGKDPDVKVFAAKTLPTLQAHGGMAEALPKS